MVRGFLLATVPVAAGVSTRVPVSGRVSPEVPVTRCDRFQYPAPQGLLAKAGHMTIAVALAVVVAGAAVFAAVQLLRPVPALTLTAAAQPPPVLPGAPPHPDQPYHSAPGARPSR